MKLSLYVTFAIGYCVLAAQYAFDPGCTTLKVQDGTILDVTAHLKDAMHDAVDVAQTAYQVLHQHPADPEVRRLCTLLIGDNPVNFQRAQATLSSVAGFQKDPFALKADTNEWRQQRTNLDVEFYVDANRFRQINEKTWEDTTTAGGKKLGDISLNQHTTLYTLVYNLEDATEKKPSVALTTISDHFDMASWWSDYKAGTVAPGGKGDPKYTTPRQQLACQVDFSTWHMDGQNKANWPRIDKATIEQAMDPEFVAKFLIGSTTGLRTPVDALRGPLSFVMLHELTHTIQGGRLKDRPDKRTCYGWKCIQIDKDPGNSDTIALLGLALTMRKWGYSVDENGHITSIDPL